MGVKKERLHTSARARELGNSLWPVRTPALLDALEKYGTLTDFDNSHIYPTVPAAVAAFRGRFGGVVEHHTCAEPASPILTAG